MTEYNGHEDWEHWNVSLWINNDEMLYSMARAHAAAFGEEDAAAMILDLLEGESTPDGAAYTYSTIREALRDIVS